MSLILHHYRNSPFAEKVRLMLGYKGLSWLSVDMPVIMPKPDLVALTGGYRKSPVLQRGAAIYCDSALIADMLEVWFPEPTLFPPASASLARCLAQWADTTLFWTIIPYAMQPGGVEHILSGMSETDRKKFALDRAAYRGNLPRMRGPEATVAFREYLHRLEDGLARQPWIAGAAPSIADFSVYHCLWFVRRAGPLAAILDEAPSVGAWLARMAAFGHGHSEVLGADAALQIAHDAPAEPDDGQPFLDSHGLARGTQVVVAATDTGTEPITGTLVVSTPRLIGIARHDARAGAVIVYFPRLGFEMKAAP